MARRHNLPPQPTSLVGRAAEVARVVELLGRPEVRLLTLTGAAGCGKTRVAIAAAELALPGFADGVAFVDLAPIADPDLVVPTIAQTLGLRDRGQRSPLDALVRHLRDQRALLLLDNFEQVVAAAPALAELIAACPGLTLLVTSRAPLHLRWEREMPIPPLPLPDPRALGDPQALLAEQPAVALFVDRARALQPDLPLDAATARAVAELCVRLDGLPLAIELAAARVKFLAPQAMVDRLERRLQLLAGGALDQPARQQTLRGAIGWSYDLLTAPEQALFRRLAVFAGGWTLEAAEALCGERARPLGGPRGEDVLGGLASLVDKNLIRQEHGRFGMLETIREYALERLLAEGEEPETRRRHAGFFLALAEDAAPRLHGPQQERWLERLAAEHDNLRAALRWCEEGDQPELGLRLVEALWWFWLVRGHLGEGRARLGRLLAIARRAHPELRAKALYAAGTLALYQSDHDAARPLFAEALGLQRELGEQAGVASALMSLGAAASQHGDLDAAWASLQEALAIHRALGDSAQLAQVLQNLGNLAQERGDLAAARQLCEEALAQAREVGWQRAVAVSLHNLGNVAQDQGDLGAAARSYEESLALKAQLGDRRSMVVTLTQLAGFLAAGGDRARARDRLAEALGIEQSLRDTAGVAFVLERCAALAAPAEPARALRLAAAASTLRQEADAPLGRAAREQLEACLTPARKALGAEAEAEWARGRALSLDEAVACALAPAAQTPAAPQETGPLSPREREVAKLVARGLTNRQIGEQLVIAERTVDGHVASILNKLGLGSRAQVAVWVVERGQA